MSKTTKIVLGILGTLGILVVVGAFLAVRLVGSAITLDSEKVQDVGQSIAVHELPPGFKGIFATDVADIKMAISGDLVSNSETIIMLMAFPNESGQSQEDLTAEMRQAFQQQTGQDITFEYVGTRDATINGQAATVDSLVGKSDNGVSMRQDIAAFTSLDGGIGLVMLVAPDGWFEGPADELFFASME